MLTLDEKKKVKDVLSDGLGINRNINLAYFLDAIDKTNKQTAEIKTEINQIISNQEILDRKLDLIIEMLNRKN